MMIVPAGSLVEWSTSVRRNCGGSCFFGPVSGRTSGGSAAMVCESGTAPVAFGSPCPAPIWPGLIGSGGRVASGWYGVPACGGSSREPCFGGSAGGPGAGRRRQRRLVGVSGASVSISRAGRSRLGGLRDDTRWQRAALQIVELVVVGIGDRRPIRRIALRRRVRLGRRIRLRRRVVLRQ